MKTTTNIAPHFEAQEGLQASQIDAEKSVIRGVKLIGPVSKNGREYPLPVLASAVSHYEGVAVNLDHPDKPTDSRSVRDRFGVIRDVVFKEGLGLYGNFHFNPKNPYAEQLVWDAQNNPSAVGFSHNARVHAKRKGNKVVVESIAGVKSMDLVADPATTNGIFEHVEDPNPEEDQVKFEEITLESLSKERPDLVKVITESVDSGEDSSKLLQAVESLKAQLDVAQTKAAKFEFAQLVESELSDSKLEDSQVSESFKNLLLKTDDADDRKAMIADRVEIFEGVTTTEDPKKKPTTTGVVESVEGELSADALRKALRRR